MAFFNFLLLPYIDAAIKSPRHLILATLKRNVYYIGEVFVEKRNGQRLYDVLPYISGLDKLMVQCPFRGAAIQFVRHSRANSSYEVNSTAICTLPQKAAGYWTQEKCGGKVISMVRDMQYHEFSTCIRHFLLNSYTQTFIKSIQNEIKKFCFSNMNKRFSCKWTQVEVFIKFIRMVLHSEDLPVKGNRILDNTGYEITQNRNILGISNKYQGAFADFKRFSQFTGIIFNFMTQN